MTSSNLSIQKNIWNYTYIDVYTHTQTHTLSYIYRLKALWILSMIETFLCCLEFDFFYFFLKKPHHRLQTFNTKERSVIVPFSCACARLCVCGCLMPGDCAPRRNFHCVFHGMVRRCARWACWWKDQVILWMDWYVRVTQIHWVLVKVSPIVTKDCNNHSDRLDLVGGAYLQCANGFIASVTEV